MNDVDDFLAHYGVAGMKWGKRNASSSDAEAGPSRKERKGMDKAERAKQRDDRDKSIVTARKDIDKAARDLNEGQAQYKADKKAIGKVAARAILDKKQVKFDELWDVAIQDTAKEATRDTLATVGLALASVALAGAVSYRGGR